MTNRIQSLLGVEYPVVQAPMTYIARAELAAAVSQDVDAVLDTARSRHPGAARGRPAS